MPTYIVLLRGINVSGQKKILMADLKRHLEELGFHDIQTYIQSGNVVFQNQKTNASIIETLIKQKILEKYAFDVSVFVLNPSEIEKIIAENPFKAEKEQQTYFTFLSEAPISAEKLEKVEYAPEEYFLKDKILYFYPPNGYGKAKLNNNLFEKKLGVEATTRNWKTVNKLLEMAK